MFEAQSGLGESEHREPPPWRRPEKKKKVFMTMMFYGSKMFNDLIIRL